MAKLTGYGACTSMLEVLDVQIKAVLQAQSEAPSMAKRMALTANVHNLARSVAVLQAELRKSVDDAKSAIDNISQEQQTELILAMLPELSPEFREAIRMRCEEMGLGVLTQ